LQHFLDAPTQDRIVAARLIEERRSGLGIGSLQRRGKKRTNLFGIGAHPWNSSVGHKYLAPGTSSDQEEPGGRII
jgi:hypothetical protein